MPEDEQPPHADVRRADDGVRALYPAPVHPFQGDGRGVVAPGIQGKPRAACGACGPRASVRPLPACLVMLAGLVLPVPSSAWAQSAEVPASGGICGRTEQVRTAILALIPGTNACDAVTATQLAAITGKLYLPRAGISSLQADDFSGLTSLTKLNLQHNQLGALPAGVFSDLTSLRRLLLSNNQLRTLPAGVFDTLTQLEELRLTSNRLEMLWQDVFANLSRLYILDLSFNELQTLPMMGMFAGLDLIFLGLEANRLTTLPAGMFTGLDGVEVLDFSHNQTSTVSPEAFSGLTSLKHLDLGYNQLTTLPAGVFAGLTNLEMLWLEKNPGVDFTFTMNVERKPGTNKVVVTVTQGAPFDMTTTLSTTGGALPADVSSVTVPTGHTTSDEIAVDPLDGTTVTLGPAPSVPGSDLWFNGFATAVGGPVTFPVPAAWSATLTVGADPSTVPMTSGYSAWGATLGTLSTATFTIDDVAYRVLAIAHRADAVHLDMTGAIPTDFVLRIGDAAFAARESAVPSSHVASYWWAAPPVTWTPGATVPVSITPVHDQDEPRPERQAAPPTAYFQSVPERHNGVDAFTFRTYFRGDIPISDTLLREHAFVVSGGAVIAAQRVNGLNRIRKITVRPHATGDVTITLPAARACDVAGAICTADGRPLYNSPKLTVPGPSEYPQEDDASIPPGEDTSLQTSQLDIFLDIEETTALAPVPLTASFENVPSSHDGSAFTFELRFSEEIAISFKTLRDDDVFTVTGGTVKKAQRLEKPSNVRWRITVVPDTDTAVFILLPPTTDCNATGAICTADGKMLSVGAGVLVPGPATPILQKALQRGPVVEHPQDDGDTQVFPVEPQTDEVRTALALHNPGDEPLDVACRFVTADTASDAVDLALAAHGQETGFIDEWFPDTEGLAVGGTVRCAAERRFTGVAVEMDTGSGFFSSVFGEADASR